MTPIIELLIGLLFSCGIGVAAGALIGFIGFKFLKRHQNKLHAEYMEAIRKNTEAYDRCKCHNKLTMGDTH